MTIRYLTTGIFFIAIAVLPIMLPGADQKNDGLDKEGFFSNRSHTSFGGPFEEKPTKKYNPLLIKAEKRIMERVKAYCQYGNNKDFESLYELEHSLTGLDFGSKEEYVKTLREIFEKEDIPKLESVSIDEIKFSRDGDRELAHLTVTLKYKNGKIFTNNEAVWGYERGDWYHIIY